MNDYNFYLFSRLYVDLVSDKETEYDLEYEIICKLYQEFFGSSFNNPMRDLYSCIILFFNNKKLLHETTL